MRRVLAFQWTVIACLALPGLAQATPALNCLLEHGGETRSVSFAPTSDPYRVESVEVGSAFRFKAVVFSEQERVAYVKLYTYYQSPRQAVLLHQASYRAPLAEPAASARSLTGDQRLFSSRLGMEFLYNCTLVEERP